MSANIEEIRGHVSPEKFIVFVVYNGIKKEVRIDPHETVKVLLDRALHAFGSLPNPHTLALFTQKGIELTNEQETVKEAGIERRDELLLRPSAVRGG